MERHTSKLGLGTYEKIKHDIIFGHLQPGDKLKLDTLKKNYATSISTLRETLSRLASEGFVSSEKQRGFFVPVVSKDDLIEITNLRILLECNALKASIDNGDDNWEADLVAAHHKLNLQEKRMLTGDHTQKEMWKTCDWEFHLALIKACNSKNLLALHSIIYAKYLRYQMIVLTHRGQKAVLEHRVMLEAALARDTSAAKKFLKQHIRRGLEHSLSAFTH